eukprot:GILJ01002139.1.p1 GENE.GILJ01002139.1~~GILJ01002139.1.p1  ORF type:complete len:643 (-),score=92.58 GILJ01002139.1:606-2294(-)
MKQAYEDEIMRLRLAIQGGVPPPRADAANSAPSFVSPSQKRELGMDLYMHSNRSGQHTDKTHESSQPAAKRPRPSEPAPVQAPPPVYDSQQQAGGIGSSRRVSLLPSASATSGVLNLPSSSQALAQPFDGETERKPPHTLPRPTDGKKANGGPKEERTNGPTPSPPEAETKAGNKNRIGSSLPESAKMSKQVVTNAVDTTAPKANGKDWDIVYNTESRDVNIDLQRTLNHRTVVCSVRFSHDGRLLASGCNRTAQVFDVMTGDKIAIFGDASGDSALKRNKTAAAQGRSDPPYVRSVCFSPDGKFLVAGAEDKTVKVWEVGNKKLHHSLDGHEEDIYSLDVSYDGRLILSGSGDFTAKIWSMTSAKELHTLGEKASSRKRDDEERSHGVTSVAFSHDARRAVIGSLDNIVSVWDAETGKHLENLDGHTDSVYSIAFSPDGRWLVSGALDRTLRLWDLSNPSNSRCIGTFEGHSDFVLSVAFSPDGRWLMSGSKDRTVVFWDPRMNNRKYMTLTGHSNSVISLAVSPAGNMFATGSGDLRARVWRYGYRGGAGAQAPIAMDAS